MVSKNMVSFLPTWEKTPAKSRNDIVAIAGNEGENPKGSNKQL